MEKIKKIALVAHDNRKKDLIEWVQWNFETLIRHRLICTGTTGMLVEEAINEKILSENGKDERKSRDKLQLDFPITKLKSGPLGGDQQMGALISEGKVDFIIFLWDPMEPQPHDVDVKALLRIAVLYNIPTACNRSTADFMISSPLLQGEYNPVIKDYSVYLSRELPE